MLKKYAKTFEKMMTMAFNLGLIPWSAAEMYTHSSTDEYLRRNLPEAEL